MIPLLGDGRRRSGAREVAVVFVLGRGVSVLPVIVIYAAVYWAFGCKCVTLAGIKIIDREGKECMARRPRPGTTLPLRRAGPLGC
jgi:hypothetical protein